MNHLSAEHALVRVALPKGTPPVDTVAYDGTRDIDNLTGTLGKDVIEAPQLGLTCLTRSWASLTRTKITSV